MKIFVVQGSFWVVVQSTHEYVNSALHEVMYAKRVLQGLPVPGWFDCGIALRLSLAMPQFRLVQGIRRFANPMYKSLNQSSSKKTCLEIDATCETVKRLFVGLLECSFVGLILLNYCCGEGLRWVVMERMYKGKIQHSGEMWRTPNGSCVFL